MVIDSTESSSSSSRSTPAWSAHPEFPNTIERRVRQAVAIEARIGRLVDQRYRITRLLGVGGMAAVYEAEQRGGERVALKMLHGAHAERLDRRKRFLREAYLANAIGHPCLARILADGVDDDGTVFLVMEHLEGQTARALQRRAGGSLSVHTVLWIADQVLDVLGAAHARGVVHRDIKPDNVFMTSDGEVKLLDFGVARIRDRIPGLTLDTLPGATLGTPKFMSPEQRREPDAVDKRSDLWALGATLFSLLTGESAVSGSAHVGGVPVAARTLRSVWPTAPAAVAAVVDAALCMDPAERWPDARSMQRAVRAARESLSQPVARSIWKDEARPFLDSTEPRRWLKLAPLVLAAVLVFGLAFAAVGALLHALHARTNNPALTHRAEAVPVAHRVAAPAMDTPAPSSAGELVIVPAQPAPARVPVETAIRSARAAAPRAPTATPPAPLERGSEPQARDTNGVVRDIVDPWR